MTVTGSWRIRREAHVNGRAVRAMVTLVAARERIVVNLLDGDHRDRRRTGQPAIDGVLRTKARISGVRLDANFKAVVFHGLECRRSGLPIGGDVLSKGRAPV